MHLLSKWNRSEFLATPQLVRFDYANGSDGREPTLLIKASTLALKYIVHGVRMQMVFSKVDDRLLYALHVFDDAEKPALLWSMAERDEELLAVRALLRGEPCQFFLFNELAVSSAWRESQLTVPVDDMESMLDRVLLGRVDYSAVKNKVHEILNAVHLGSAPDGVVLVDAKNRDDWKTAQSTYITNRLEKSTLELFDKDEGRQQENIGLWLTDSLHPSGAHHSLQVPSGKVGGKQRRELTDIALSYEYGSIFIESKALSIFIRNELPSREKLAKDVSGHIEKAVAQLRGGIRKVRSGAPIMDKNGNPVEIERKYPIHAIVLIPEFALVEDASLYGRKFIVDFMEATDGFLHLLDIAELLRVVQAAQMISERSKSLTPMMAFDHYLMERVEKSGEVGTLCFEMLFRFAD
ncbi:hypothetical protein MAFF301069_15780 [Ralstonia pseudosolanacearum]|uniref:hypothetical protein n=1 Tax=Ralstonia pseudosolanacearum TaxID=1310165 RepID=UPI000E93821C|nr:hypothetical protein CJO84_07825 [Ralstonia solanacearum]BEU67023.1 hypothetical protein MAFF301069_15780 [Ralstonia pseudosolanacearum]